MSQITPRKFYDDVHNFHEIRIVLKRKRYTKSFEFLYDLFFNSKQTFVNSLMLQGQVCIADHSTAYQILSSLSILNLLEIKKMGHRKVLFIPINKSWWEIFKKEIDKNGNK